MNNSYDYIIVGAGCAGLSLLMRMLDDSSLKSKSILLVDRVAKQQNDRTWCFWERGEGFFEPAVCHQWQNLYVRHSRGEKKIDLGAYSYKMIRGADFYRYCFDKIRGFSNVNVLYGEVSEIDAEKGTLVVNDRVYSAGRVFSSVLLAPPLLKPGQWYLLQHFRGWWIETETDCFDPANADLMNFRTSQEHGCTFLYVLPLSKRRALVEYTLFSEEKLEPEQYDKGLRDFIAEELKLKEYRIVETENGVIPMTNLVFPSGEGKITFIGTAGGQTKASTGYTFQFIQRHSENIISWLTQNLPVQPAPARFRFYDSVLLNILAGRKLEGADVFFRMFMKNRGWRVFRFLDNQTGFGEELMIMQSTRKAHFMRAALAEWNV